MNRLMNDLLSGRVHDMRQVTVLDACSELGHTGQIDADGDSLESRCDVTGPWLPTGSQVRVQIPAGTPQADAVRLLRKVATWLESGHTLDYFEVSERAIAEAAALLSVARVPGDALAVARVLSVAAMISDREDDAISF